MTKGSSAARQDLRKRRGLSKLEQGYMGFVLILPWLIGFCIFKLYPFVSSLVYSFTDYDLFRGVQNVVGFQNYIDAFTKAKNVKALKVTFTYAFMTVPLKLIFALFIAYILNFKIKGVGLFRTAYYVPSILGGSVAIAVLWKALFKNDGVVNTILTMLGFESINFLADKNWALFIICLLRVWQFGSAMVLFLAALKGVPEDLRGGQHRRRDQGPPVPLHHHSADLPGDLLQPGDAARAGVPGVQRPVHHHQRRPAQRDDADLRDRVQHGVQGLQGGHVLSDGVGHVRDRDDPDHHRVRQPEEVGLLFR